MPDLSKITIDELIQMLREERDDLPTDELIRILREKPDGLHAAAIIEALQQRWLGLLRGSFASLGFAAHLDITQDTWVRLQARLRDGTSIRKLWSFSDKICRTAAKEWNRKEKGRRRDRRSDRAGQSSRPTSRTHGIKVPLDNVTLFDPRPTQEETAIHRQRISRMLDGFDRKGSLATLTDIALYGDGDEEDKDALAAKLGCSRVTLRKIVQRARDKLRKLR